MGTFRTTISIASHARPDELLQLPNTLVDTGSELTWVPREVLESLDVRPLKTLLFRVADGRTSTRRSRRLVGGKYGWNSLNWDESG
jgi:hypothetical protein